MNLLQSRQFQYLDQDMLNLIFNENYLHLPVKFNHLVANIKSFQPDFKTVTREIYHYNGLTINAHMHDELNQLFWTYFIKTPFFTVDSIGNFCNGLESYFQSQINFWQQIFKISTEKRRGFFSASYNFQPMIKYFGQPEIMVDSQHEQAIDLLIRFIRENFFFLIITEPQQMQIIRYRLNEENFVENVNFFDTTLLFLQRWQIEKPIMRQM